MSRSFAGPIRFYSQCDFSDKCGHGGDAGAAGGDVRHLDDLAPPLEVLRHHQRRRVPRHAHPNACNRKEITYSLFFDKVSGAISGRARAMRFASHPTFMRFEHSSRELCAALF